MADYSSQGKLSLFPFDTRYRPIAPPDTGIFDEPTAQVCINVKWIAHIDGALERLLWPDAWLGDATTQQRATGEITKLLVALIQRNPCGGEDCMGECCDDIIERLEAIEALLAAGPVRSPDEIRDDINGVEEAYETFITETDAVYEGDITNVHPEMQYGDSSDPIRDQALCFMTRRFVDLFCDWIIKNIEWKQNNQQTALTIASFIGEASEVASRLFAETAFGPLFTTIDQMLELEVSALTLWVTTVSVSELAVYQDEDARQAVACGWYDELKGQTPTVSLFLSSLTDAVLTGNADIMRDKLAAVLVPVDAARDPDPEHIFFIWADLWKEAYDGTVAGIVPDCLCIDPNPSDPACEDLTIAPTTWKPVSGNAVHYPGTGWGPYNAGAPGWLFRIEKDRPVGMPTRTYYRMKIYCNQAIAGLQVRVGNTTQYTNGATAMQEFILDESNAPSLFPITQNVSSSALIITFNNGGPVPSGFRIHTICLYETP